MPSMQIERYDLHLTNLRTRMPFRYGIATMTEVPHLFVRLWVSTEGKSSVGISADLLPPKWFTKDAAKPLDEEIAEMLRVIRHALSIAVDLRGRDAFEIWQQLYRAQNAWGAAEGLPPLLCHLGTSLVERALLESLCRNAGRSFGEMLKANRFGIQLGQMHAPLLGRSPAEFLPDRPRPGITVRHTVGLADPLTNADIPPAERLEDGLPQSLEDCIGRYGLRHFKLKLSGEAARDLDRLLRIAALLEQKTGGDFSFSLDGNEQFKSTAEFRSFWETTTERLPQFFQHLLFVEQPLHRDEALQPEVGAVFRPWQDRPPIIIDESDATLDDLPLALSLGYAGTSHKNCKGVFKGIAHFCLLEQLRRRHPEATWVLSGEDLCNIGPVALLQDLAVMAALGIESVERNGHHYHAGLSQFPPLIQREVLQHHADLYQPSPAGWPTLRIERGHLDLGSVNGAPFGVGFLPDLGLFQRIGPS